MQETPTPNLETALAKTEADASRTVKAAQAVLLATRKMHKAARDGNLKDLRSSFDAVDKTQELLREQLQVARSGWTFDEDGFLAGRGYVEELLAAAKAENLDLFERDERLYCYPVLLRVMPRDRAVRIDKQMERRLRPSVLVANLKGIQKRPPRFSPDAFLRALHAAWQKSIRTRALESEIATVPLVDIYELLTLLPGQSKEYSRQEFVRDIYLLERSGHLRLDDGTRVDFPASTATKSERMTLRVIKEDGEEKKYYGVCFLKG